MTQTYSNTLRFVPVDDEHSAEGDALRPGRVLPAKTPLFHQGDKAGTFYKIKSGVVMTYRLLEDSQRQITGFYGAGEFVGLTPDRVYHNTAMTVTTANIVSVPLSNVEANPALKDELFKRTCAQLEHAQSMMMTLSKKTAGEKVAAFLIMLARRQGVSENNMSIFLPMSRQDIGDFLGITIETVSRRLTYLKSEGVISLPSRHRVNIRDLDALKQMAGALT